MSTNSTAQSPILKQTTKSQNLAAAPESSAFVSANAGTGKTYILVNRVLRLLLAGNAPHRILCLTYTNAAAAEMENRLFKVLSNWATMDEADLEETLKELLNRAPSPEELMEARRLFAKAIEAPGGMKVQTIHSFCEKLLQRFPLEANVPPHFNVLDESKARDILALAMQHVLKAALKQPESRGGKALKTLIAYATDTQFETLIAAVLRHKSRIAPLLGPNHAQLQQCLEKILNLPKNQSPSTWRAQMVAVLERPLINGLIPLLQEMGGSTNEATARALQAVATATSEEQKITALKAVFLTAKNERRARLITKAVGEQDPLMADQLLHAQDQFMESFNTLESITIAKASSALLELADQIIQSYEIQKQQRSALDYQDLIDRTANLLITRANTQWVLFKLDQGLDHILVDEAQDTSPEQWKIISNLANEFFADIGTREKHRTLFAVGDEKQSIYGFQGANPREFQAMGQNFAQNAAAAGKEFNTIPLNLSFRSTAAVLSAVDHVFNHPDVQSALTVSANEIKHFSHRETEPGLVEIWPTITTDKTEKADPFAPLSESPGNNAAEELAQKIAKTIKQWLTSEKILPSKNRPIEPGDILILVRKRAPFAPLMIKALKAENIPVAGADRIILTEQLAVMDMLALGQFLMLPEDDLSLANVLKSPIFNLSEEDLFKLANKRKRSLWQSLRYFAKREEKFQEVAATLSLWLGRADILPPFEFFANLLEGEGLRKKFISRMGAVAGDALDEFLNRCLHYDDEFPPSLEGFLSWLQQSEAEIKRDMEKGRNEVRIMTVHGAKGLESEIVFLPDTCSTGSASQSEAILAMEHPDAPEGEQAGKPLIWALAGKGHLPALAEGRRKIKQAEHQEQLRLLYVAMTRAKEQLYITGFETAKGRGKNCWYDCIQQGLEGETVSTLNEQGEPVEQLITGKPQEGDDNQASDGEELLLPPRPAWAGEKVPSEKVRTIPVAPSSLLPYETPEDDEEKIPQEPALISPKMLGEEGRFIRGRLVHTLLEHLPDLEQEHRLAAANSLAKAYGKGLTENAIKSIINETMGILNNPEFKDLFGPGSRAEVALMAKLTPKDKSPILLQGQIDRLLVRDKEILIVDYKSNRPSPRKVEDVAEAYLAQLAAYREALVEIYPKHTLRAALLWTDGPFFMEIPDALLDQYQELLRK